MWPPGERGLSMEAFMAVRPAGGQEGDFRFALAGPEKLKLSFPINKLLPDPAFDNMVAELELVPGDQIKLEKNSVATTWWDLEDLVGPRMLSSLTGREPRLGTSS